MARDTTHLHLEFKRKIRSTMEECHSVACNAACMYETWGEKSRKTESLGNTRRDGKIRDYRAPHQERR
ncbi:hypothetical protein JMJ77_0012475 [Colletotrichum scovillei]|uniref:Uncharacterized protein n=1 Tax=Colletotrichum scovillei TaxID=1209932 RepID=A0A9P7QSB5_9PEZI|nr:hypothetical protein JMJ78_0001531 [Colletotrichum scovillei]KAG7041959.1 hypothetical protein JMJ77_0012475 [Colletotrichum scovillei]KAG7061990.1 hypothetical protein JMJ76_0003944 [Colletotrichum scovillei]